MDFDLVILGCGAAGVEAAKEALKFGKRILCIDKSPENIGGTCLNRGCVPTKHLREGVSLIEKIEHLELYGLKAELKTKSLERAIKEAKERVIKTIREATYKYLKSRGVKFLFASDVKFISRNTLSVDGEKLTSEYFLLATGSRPGSVPKVVPDGKFVLDTDSVWNVKENPRRVLIVGAGPGGVEFANIFRGFGSEVFVVELADRILPTIPNLSTDLVRRLERDLKNRGVEIFTKTVVEEIDKNSKSAKLSNGQTLEDLDFVLLTVGRKPNSDNLGLENIGVKLGRKGLVEVSNGYRSLVENIFAVGDLIPTPALANVAKHEAIFAVRNMFLNQSEELDYDSVPSVVYSSYEIGAFGKGERELKESKVDFKVRMATFRAVAKALTEREEGLIKVFVDAEGKIVGANVLSRKHTDSILHLLLLAKLNGRSVRNLRNIVWAHPTVEEVLELL